MNLAEIVPMGKTITLAQDTKMENGNQKVIQPNLPRLDERRAQGE